MNEIINGLREENAKLLRQLEDLKDALKQSEVDKRRVQQDAYSKILTARADAERSELLAKKAEDELSSYHERLREAIQSERKRWAKEDVEALRVRDIQQQIKALGEVKDKWIKKASEMPLGLECTSKGSSCYNWAMFYAKELTDEVEQLRKELEK